jgi:hypothetical protein
VIKLKKKLSPMAEDFLQRCSPVGLDRRGWHFLANAPVGGWPSREIIGAMADDRRVSVFVPIDVLGMLTDRNPSGLYLSGKTDHEKKRRK